MSGFSIPFSCIQLSARKPWTAEILGLCDMYVLDRDFLKAREQVEGKDIIFRWFLEPGCIYEHRWSNKPKIRRRPGWPVMAVENRRYFECGADGILHDLSFEEVKEAFNA